MSRKVILIGAGLAFAVAGIWAWVATKRQESNGPFVIGQKYLEALLHADANEVWRLADHHEFENNGMSKDDLQRFLSGWVTPKIVRVEGDAYEAYGTGTNGFQTYSWGVATTEGRLPIGVSVAKCDDGLKVVLPLTTIFCTFVGVQPNHVRARSGEEVMQCYWENGLRLAPELAPFHFTILQQSASSAPISIKDFALHNRDKLVAYRRTHVGSVSAPSRQ